jgi:hypothetical protein
MLFHNSPIAKKDSTVVEELQEAFKREIQTYRIEYRV